MTMPMPGWGYGGPQPGMSSPYGAPQPGMPPNQHLFQPPSRSVLWQSTLGSALSGGVGLGESATSSSVPRNVFREGAGAPSAAAGPAKEGEAGTASESAGAEPIQTGNVHPQAGPRYPGSFPGRPPPAMAALALVD